MSSWCESKGYRFSFLGFAGCLADGAAGGLGAEILGTVCLAGARWGGCVIVAGGLAGGGRCCGYGDEGVAAEGIGKGAGRRD